MAPEKPHWKPEDDIRYATELENGNPLEEVVESPEEPLTSRLNPYISQEPLPTVIGEIDSELVANGQLIEVNENNELVFDEKTFIQTQIQQIDRLLLAIDNEEDRLHWYFEEDNPQARQIIRQSFQETRALLAQKLSTENPVITELQDQISSSYGPVVQERIQQAAELVKGLSQKEMIRNTVRNQVPYMPIDTIVTTSGKEVAFNAENLFDEGGAFNGDVGSLDWMYVVNPRDRTPELIISSQHGIKHVDVEAQFNAVLNTISADGKFEFVVSPESSADEFVLEVRRGKAYIDPLFKRVRIIRPPFSLDRELKKFQENEELQRQRYNSQAQSASSSQSYSSRSSTPRYTSSG